MPDGEQLIYVVAALLDTGDQLGSGGMRRPDGTQASQVRNPTPIDKNTYTQLTQPPTPSRPGGSAFALSLARGAGSAALAAAFDVILRDVVVPATVTLWNEQVAPAVKRKWSEQREKKARGPEAVEILEPEPADAETTTDVTAADELRVELTREQAEWRIAEAQRAASELAEHLAVLRAARIVDDSDIPALLEGRGQLETSTTDATDEDSEIDEDPAAQPLTRDTEGISSPPLAEEHESLERDEKDDQS